MADFVLNEDIIKAMKRSGKVLTESIAVSSYEADHLLCIAEDNADLPGFDLKILQGAVEIISQELQAAAGPAEMLSDRINKIEDLYMELMKNDLFC